ncbi:MAG: GGDEF domain-containing protein [Alphaproteobacteria bacterium]|nr:GGDEF domain-containing protein [Alphaproteobacteria bacterium]
MAPPQVIALDHDRISRDAVMVDVSSTLGVDVHPDPPRLMRLLVQALHRIAKSEQLLSEKDLMIASLKSQAMTDPLTELANRRAFEEQVRRAIAGASRFDEAGVLAYIDLDGFKPINDLLGHEAGDAVLIYVADFLRNSVRLTDTVARLGGDEFAILMVQTTPDEGERRARTLQLLMNSSHLTFQGNLISVSASMGVAPFFSGADPRAVMRLADAAMYTDKGRRKMHSNWQDRIGREALAS